MSEVIVDTQDERARAYCSSAAQPDRNTPLIGLNSHTTGCRNVYFAYDTRRGCLSRYEQAPAFELLLRFIRCKHLRLSVAGLADLLYQDTISAPTWHGLMRLDSSRMQDRGFILGLLFLTIVEAQLEEPLRICTTPRRCWC